MKIIRIILLILIVIGTIALATQGIWVPKLVDKIISSDKAFLVVPVMDPNNSTTGNNL